MGHLCRLGSIFEPCNIQNRVLMNNVIKWLMCSLLLMKLFLKILIAIANSVDPDQTAPVGAV